MWQKYYVEGKSLDSGSAMEFLALGLNMAGMAMSGKGMVESGNKICKSIKESGVTNKISGKVKAGAKSFWHDNRGGANFGDLVGTDSISKKAKNLRYGNNGTIVEVNTKKEANTLLEEAFLDYQKVNGSGSQDAKGIRKRHKLGRYKKGGAYHKDYTINSKTGRIYGHDDNNPHGQYPHINIKRTDGKTVMINIIGGSN